MPDEFYRVGDSWLNLSQWARVWNERRRREREDADRAAFIAVAVPVGEDQEDQRDRLTDGSLDLLEQGRV